MNRRPTMIRQAILLSWFTICFNLIEGIVSVYFGIAEESMSLAGFGFDSFIELASATMVLWRFRAESGGEAAISLDRERHATLTVGNLFILLGGVTMVGACFQLFTGNHPVTTLPGMIIASISIATMFFLYYSKMKVAHALNSATVLADAACTMACIKLSFILFAGSFLFYLGPALWWADSVTAICLSVLIAKEGIETRRAALHKDFSGGCGSICCTQLPDGK